MLDDAPLESVGRVRVENEARGPLTDEALSDGLQRPRVSPESSAFIHHLVVMPAL